MQVGTTDRVNGTGLIRVVVGYRWPGAIPIAWRSLLPWRRLLRARIRCEQLEEF